MSGRLERARRGSADACQCTESKLSALAGKRKQEAEGGASNSPRRVVPQLLDEHDELVDRVVAPRVVPVRVQLAPQNDVGRLAECVARLDHLGDEPGVGLQSGILGREEDVPLDGQICNTERRP